MLLLSAPAEWGSSWLVSFENFEYICNSPFKKCSWKKNMQSCPSVLGSKDAYKSIYIKHTPVQWFFSLPAPSPPRLRYSSGLGSDIPPFCSLGLLCIMAVSVLCWLSWSNNSRFLLLPESFSTLPLNWMDFWDFTLENCWLSNSLPEGLGVGSSIFRRDYIEYQDIRLLAHSLYDNCNQNDWHVGKHSS